MNTEQNEIKKVISVDVGGASTSLKEYKEYIDRLRGSLLQLDETSEEYQKISQEVKTAQDKLNEVMRVGKGYTDAADGSYNQLVQTMSELKKQWRATADETERAELGNKILDINNQLKELDASTGNYQRNVGDYANAFEKAFSNALGGINSLHGPLGSVLTTTRQMLPTIKAINKEATAGLAGIKKGIASTGIGLLVVALGTILANWKEISEWVKKTTGFVDEQAEAVKALQYKVEDINGAWEKANELLEYREKMMRAAGKTELEIRETDLEEQRKLTNKAVADELAAWNAYYLHKDDVDRKYVKSLKETAESLTEARKKQDEEEEKSIRSLNEKRQEEITKMIEGSKEYGEEVYNIMTGLQEQLEEAVSGLGDVAHRQIGIYEEYYNKVKDVYDTNAKIAEANKQQEEEEKKRAAEAKKRAEEAARQAKAEADRRAAEVENERKKAQALIDSLNDQKLNEFEILEKNYNEQKALLERFGMDTTLLTEKYLNDRLKLNEDYDSKIEAEQRRHQEEINELMENNLSDSTSKLEKEAEYQQALNEIVEDNERERATKQYEIEQQLITDKIALLEEFLQVYEGDTTETEDTLEALRQQYHLNELKRKKEEQEAMRDTVKDIVSAASGTANTMGNLFGAIGDMMEENSEEAKAFAIMQATMNTFSSAVAAYNSAAQIPYVGYILGPIAATAATIAGIANIAKIKNAKPGGDTTATQASTPSMSMTQVSPLLNEQADLNRLEENNVTGDTSMKVYVVESDIREASRKVDVREDNATF